MAKRTDIDWEGMPVRMRRLPVEERGYPVPWFVKWIEGKPEFRVMDEDKFYRALVERLCWVCGDPLGVWLAFVLGPMCGISRSTAEPPLHAECARWSIRNCPFLTKPQMVRRQHEELREAGATSVGGNAILRNPGVTLLWVTRTFKMFRPQSGGILIEVGPQEYVEWFREGRAASRAEVEESVNSGLPLLEAECQNEPTAERKASAHFALVQEHKRLQELYPKASG
jgi:hypothetical protein